MKKLKLLILPEVRKLLTSTTPVQPKVTEVNTAGTTQVNAVNTAGTNKLNDINAAGAVIFRANSMIPKKPHLVQISERQRLLMQQRIARQLANWRKK